MKKKKILLLIVLLVICVVGIRKLDLNLKYNLSVLDYYKYNSVLTPREKTLLQEKPFLVGLYNDPPLAFLNEFNNYNTGIVVDYLSQLAIELRNDIHLKVESEEYLSDALNNEEIDIAVVERTPDNEKRFEISQPLCVVKGKILVKNNLDIDSIYDLNDMRLVALKSDYRNGSIQEYFKTKHNIEIIEVENIYQCFALINKDVAVGFVGDDMEAAHFLKVTNRETNFSFLKPTVYEKEICLATQKGNYELVNILNKGILELKKKNLIAQTQYKWLGNFHSDSLDLQKIELTYKILIGITLIIAIFSSWNYIITQRVNSKTRELSESKEELRLIIDTMRSGIMVIKNDSTIIECNKAVEKLAGIARDNLIGINYNQIEALQPFINELHMNQVFNVKKAYYYITCQNFSSNKKLISIEDYTEKYVHEKTARQEAKMIAIGQLSAGLAHEIRNPLGLIKSYSYIIEKYCTDEIGKHAISVINDSVGRINKLIENLLRFSRLSNDENKLVDIESLLNVILELETKNIEQNNITINSWVGGKYLRPIVMNEDVLKMILLNLLNNSIDSFEGIEREAKIIKLSLIVEESHLNIKISDNGCGIEKEIIEDIFNPFYSTKEKGTGLGLYVISTEIFNNDGKISVESNPGDGTEFDIILPIKE
ncbi:ATP-binding protein [Aminipila sp.]|uniref:ATP-binding protein n=1 Tax=Aminipila sp. TaxID=2060095 RepID=UPI00289C8541|nr:transporter substrate-binding domain-containing protein [Aminipila sp.]